MASAQAIQASCQATATQKDNNSEMVTRYVAGWANLAAHPKFAIRSFFVRRTRNEQGANSASCAAKNRANPVGREEDYLYSSPRW
jgi:hypothetical protein